MSGFVANSPTITETDVSNTSFYPAISPTECREVMRIDGSITAERLRHALINAMTEANDNLSLWMHTQQAQGYASLTDVPADQIDGVSINIQLYQRAVYNWAKAEITERYRDYDSTLKASQRAETLDETIDHYRREAIIAIRAISGRQRTTIELI